MIVWIHREQRGDDGTWWVRWETGDIYYAHSRAVVDKMQQMFHPISNPRRFRLYYGGNSIAVTSGDELEEAAPLPHAAMQLMVSPETFTDLYDALLRYLHMMER